MVFTSRAQMRKCFAEQRNNGATWDCKKTYDATKTKFRDLPEYKIRIGPKGGQYILKKGKKIYVTKKLFKNFNSEKKKK